MIQTINVYYGGNYEEHWTPEQRLFISYSSRETFTAEKSEGRWVCTTHLPSYPLSETYFQAVCEIQEAMQTCSQLGLDARRLTDLLQTDNVVAPFELLRALLDDWGYQFYDALNTVSRCCRNIDTGIRFEDLVRMQPRTAFLTDVLYQGLKDFTIAYHDRKDPLFRNPVSAVREGSLLHLGFRDCGRRIPSASCIIFGDFGERIFPMRRTKQGFQADIAMHFEPQPLWYVFRLETDNGYQYLNSDSTGFGSVVSPQRGLGFRLTVFKKDFETPEWFRHCIMYQIFPDRFATSDDNTARKGLEYHRSLGQSPDFHESTDEPVKWQARPGEDFYSPDDFYGGTLKGIISKLDYLHDLGVGVIYLNPIVEAKSNHRYDTSDYMAVDPILGSVEDYEDLCRKAKKLGIRIINDGVFSHTGADSVYFNRYRHYPQMGACQGSQSPYFPWYTFHHFNDRYKCWWNFRDLPEVDEENPVWQDFVITGKDSVVKTWLRRGASGWRLDVADELPDDVLSLIRKSSKEEKPDAVILGEVWEDCVLKESYGYRRNYALGYSLDTVMNYPFRSHVLAFLHGYIDAYALRDFLDDQRYNYPEPLYYSLMNLLSSHDVERMRTYLAADFDVNSVNRAKQIAWEPTEEALQRASMLERLGAVIQFTVPGVPDIYYGDEVGMSGCRDPFNRAFFHEEEYSPLEHYRALAALRNGDEVLRTGDASFSAYGNDVILIHRFNDTDEYVIAVNRAKEPRPVKLPISGTDLLTGETVPQEFDASPMTAYIIRN